MPKYLFKIIAFQGWLESQLLDFVILPEEDKEFIHLATEEQLSRIINKYWSGVSEYAILKIETALLIGKLAFEANHLGGNKYYHLYDGNIPLKSVVDIKIIKRTRRYHHYGIPTKDKRDDESLVEVGGFKFYSTPFEANKWHIQWHRFPDGHGLPELVTKVPHIAFQVDDLDSEINGCKILFGPYSPINGYRVAMIEEEGVPIELVETSLSDEQLALLEQEKLGKFTKGNA